MRFIFVVDIYNEGVDIPEVNTVLFLRPTESLTIFLQQLRRASSFRKRRRGKPRTRSQCGVGSGREDTERHDADAGG